MNKNCLMVMEGAGKSGLKSNLRNLAADSSEHTEPLSRRDNGSSCNLTLPKGWLDDRKQKQGMPWLSLGSEPINCRSVHAFMQLPRALPREVRTCFRLAIAAAS